MPCSTRSFPAARGGHHRARRSRRTCTASSRSSTWRPCTAARSPFVAARSCATWHRPRPRLPADPRWHAGGIRRPAQPAQRRDRPHLQRFTGSRWRCCCASPIPRPPDQRRPERHRRRASSLIPANRELGVPVRQWPGSSQRACRAQGQRPGPRVRSCGRRGSSSDQLQQHRQAAQRGARHGDRGTCGRTRRSPPASGSRATACVLAEDGTVMTSSNGKLLPVVGKSPSVRVRRRIRRG